MFYARHIPINIINIIIIYNSVDNSVKSCQNLVLVYGALCAGVFCHINVTVIFICNVLTFARRAVTARGNLNNC